MLGTGEMDSMVLEVGVGWGWGAIESTVLLCAVFRVLHSLVLSWIKRRGIIVKRANSLLNRVYLPNDDDIWKKMTIK